MIDFNYYLDRKYRNMENENESMAQERAARSDLLSAQADAVPLEAQAQAGLRRAQAGLAGQETEASRLSNLQGQLIEQEVLPAQRAFFQGTNRRDPTGRTIFEMFNSGPVRPNIFRFNDDEDDLVRSRPRSRPGGYAKGTAEVMKKGKTKVVDKSGKGRPNVDTVPAMLAEGEAVLNVGAAERMGRGNIRQMNKQGLRDMNMDDKARPTMKKNGRLGAYAGIEMAAPKASMRGYMYGTPDVKGYMGGTDKVMMMKTPGYAEGTGSVGASTPATAQEVNDAGTLRRQYSGMRGYAMGEESVPGMAPEERDSFERRRELSNLNEATPSGTFDDAESAGEPGSVTNSLDITRLRQQYGMGQGFAMGSERIRKMKMKMPMIYAAEGMDRVPGIRERLAAGLRGFREAIVPNTGTTVPNPVTPAAAAAPAAPVAPSATAAAPTFEERRAAAARNAQNIMGQTSGLRANAPVGTQGELFSRAAPSAAAPASVDSVAARQAAAVERARLAMGESATAARQPMGGGAGSGAPPTGGAPAAAPAAPSAAPSATRTALGNLRTIARGTIPTAVGLGAVDLFARGMEADTGQGYGDLAEQMTVGTLLEQPVRDTPVSLRQAALQAQDQASRTAAAAPAAATAPATVFAVRPAYSSGLRGVATIGSMLGNRGSQSVMSDLTEREAEDGRNARAALAAAAERTAKSGKAPEFYDPPTVDPKTKQVVAGAKRDDLQAAYVSTYEPQFAANKGKIPAQLSPTEKAEAVLGFNLNRASQNYGLTTGANSFDFTRDPIDISSAKYVEDLPMFSRLFGKSRGETSFGEGFWDKGAIVISDGRRDDQGNLINVQELPVDFLSQSGALRDPALAAFVKKMRASSRQQD